MLAPSIKSRPVYPGFALVQGAQRHIVALEGEGALALLELVQPGDPELARVEIMYAPGTSAAAGHAEALTNLGAAHYWQAVSPATLTTRLHQVLATATMSSRLYASGSEPFIGEVVRAGAAFGVKHLSIITEHRGSMKRRVQCVHCKGFIDDVTISPVPCTHCGLHLFVRDHFSRRFNAFQGVSIHAEEHDVIPSAEELYR